jgi:2-desacetyl-2-hydroxyethyl bacteriochlorophyllide A dehydrogenase
MQGIRAVVPEPRVTTFESFEVGEPGPGQILVATEASGVSPGTELAIYTGIHQWLNDPTNTWAKFPFVPGYSAVGRVLAVGDGVTRFREGDRVAFPGRHESHALVQTDGATEVWPISNDVNAAEAGLLPLARFPLSALAQSRSILGQSVAVLGLGSIGQITLRLFNAAGAFPLIGVDSVAGRRERAEATYGVRTVDPTAGDPAAAVRELLGGARPDIVVDATGAPPALQDALKLVADGGQVVLVGSPRGIIQNFDSYWDLHGRSVTVTGAHGSAIGASARDKFPFTRGRAWPLLIHLLESGKLRLSDLITHTVDGRELDSMYRGLLERRDEFLSVALLWNQDKG